MMFTKLKTVLFMAVVLVCATGISFAAPRAGCDGPPYPENYPFGQDGDAGHPGGYDGFPGGHPDNPNSPNGGQGGNGTGNANGGCGGEGVNGGTGGTGGQSGPNGGCGGEGGAGGDNPGGFGGAGGAGGQGVDCGGTGGAGGEGTSGGAGGCGGNATGANGTGGTGGDGGTANGGIGGTGGCGGHASGAGGCGGDSGNGGNLNDDVSGGGSPGLPGIPGLGDANGGPNDEPCDGDFGDAGRRIRVFMAGFEIMPVGLTYKAAFLTVRGIPDNDPIQIAALAQGWGDLVGTGIKLGTQQFPPYQFDSNGMEIYRCLLHPNSLLGDTIRITLEGKVVGAAPFIQVLYGANAEIATVPNVPTPLEDGWMSYTFTVVRPLAGVALGKHLDMFEYSGRDIDVRLFEVHDLGKKGDVNLDSSVNFLDATIVLNNFTLSGSIAIEDGDTNLDGVVDGQDVLNVLGAMSE